MSRIRTVGALSTNDHYNAQSQWQTCSETSLTTLAQNQCFGTGQKRLMIDTVIPGYHRKVAKGEVFFNPMYSERTVAFRDGGTGARRVSTVPTLCGGVPRYRVLDDDGPALDFIYYKAAFPTSGNIAPGVPAPFRNLIGGDLDDLADQVSTSVHNERGRSDSNLWETLAESDQALGMLHGIFKKANTQLSDITLKSLKRDLGRNPKGFTKKASGAYLAWRYGLKPLISDVQSVIDGLQRKVGRTRKTSRASGTIRRSSVKTYTLASTVIFTVQEQCFDTLEIRGMSLDEYYASQANNIGLTSKGLLTLPWELVKYSFVVDWFANVGDFLGAITPTPGWTNLGSCLVLKREQQTSISPVSSVASTGWALERPMSGGYTSILTSTQRYGGLRAPRIVTKSNFRFDNLTRCLDAFSLLAQRVL